jgi:rRNA maturation endonuclease Nob1
MLYSGGMVKRTEGAEMNMIRTEIRLEVEDALRTGQLSHYYCCAGCGHVELTPEFMRCENCGCRAAGQHYTLESAEADSEETLARTAA